MSSTLNTNTDDFQQRYEIKKPISAKEYMQLLEYRDPNFQTLRKERKIFIWEKQF